MKKSGVLAIVTILIGVLFAFSSCEQSTSTEFDESFDVIQNVSPISGAQDVSMDLKNDRNQAQFIVDFSNIEQNNLINNGTKEAWCIEWDDNAIEGTQNGVKLYSTKGQAGWDKLNYFLNIKNQLQEQDPELTWKEIQVVIWSLVEHKPFDVDEIPNYQNFDNQFYENGEYKFNVQKVKNIVSQVKSEVSSNKLKGELNYSVSAVIVENDGQTVMVEGDETFWAFGTAYNFRCDDKNGPDTKDGDGQWGWAYDFNNTDPNSQTTELVAGAGQSDCPDPTVEDAGGTIVGDVTIERNGDDLTITLSVLSDSDYAIDVVHIDVDDVLSELVERINNDGGNVPPGQFPLQWSDDENGEWATEVTFTVDLVENGLNDASNLYFAIHGVSGVVSE